MTVQEAVRKLKRLGFDASETGGWLTLRLPSDQIADGHVVELFVAAEYGYSLDLNVETVPE